MIEPSDYELGIDLRLYLSLHVKTIPTIVDKITYSIYHVNYHDKFFSIKFDLSRDQ